MKNGEMLPEMVDASIKVTPPLAVTGMTIFGVALPDIVAVATLIYITVNVSYIIYKWKKGK